MRFLDRVQESGEVGHELVRRIMKIHFRNGVNEALIIGNIITWHHQIKAIL